LKILLVSYTFPPSVGGIETVSRLLAQEFLRTGHQVRVVTDTIATTSEPFPYPVARRPGWKPLVEYHAWCDVVFHNNISLNYAWPLLFIRRPWVIAHHVWIGGESHPHWRERLKKHSLRHATNLAVSRAVAAKMPVPAELVGDPYDDAVFFEAETPVRKKDLIYTGRLVSDKGIDLLLLALGKLKQQGIRPELTVAGDGSQRSGLQQMSAQLGLAEQVVFTGQKSPGELADLLRGHRIQVVPSRWEEPFGIVALEGLACGCKLIVAESGGLLEAAGSSALVFKRGDADSLECALLNALDGPPESEAARQGRLRHLAVFQKSNVAAQYLAAFQTALSKP
jgi:glycogen synthase